MGSRAAKRTLQGFRPPPAFTPTPDCSMMGNTMTQPSLCTWGHPLLHPCAPHGEDSDAVMEDTGHHALARLGWQGITRPPAEPLLLSASPLSV